ncbi:hypothetical protein N8H22_15220 [Stutzerimonas stutzeri]|nr:hypothetical protein [Stutzerimonas sp. S1]MCW3149954.1 hypothetical protein [Stutzerimonas sp. S1]
MTDPIEGHQAAPLSAAASEVRPEQFDFDRLMARQETAERLTIQER